MDNIIKKVLEAAISAGVPDEKYYDKFCEELEKANVDENEHDYCELFEKALLQANLIK